MSHQFGDKVRWSSQAAGSRKEKTGVIVAVVAGGVMTKEIVRRIKEQHNAVVKLDNSYRDHDSYLVLVDDAPRRPKLYWPRVSHLQGAEEAVS